jgi:cell division protease FtsH
VSTEHEEFDAAAFGRKFVEFIEMMHRIAPKDPSELHARLSEHLGQAIDGLPVVSDAYPVYQHANVQLAIDTYLAEPDHTGELIGVAGPGREHHALSELLSGMGYGLFRLGAPDYVSVPVGVESEHTCVSFGCYLITDGSQRFAVFVRKSNERGPSHSAGINLEVIAASPDTAHGFLRALRRLTVVHNIFRGQVISFEAHEFGRGVGPLSFHLRPELPADDVILPAGVLDAVHRQVKGVAEHRERLLAAGHHLKRGVLLFGPPGTGKTHTIRHLMHEMPQATVIILTGLGLGMVREACALARVVEPALVVLEDVDLVAEERSFQPGANPNPLLYQVLNEMDGIFGGADIAFLLTTNRVDLLEPALAQRPGRVDLAVEVPRPDDAGRRRLLALYGRHLELTEEETAELVAATAGATASLFAELARRAELLAASDGAARAGAGHARAALTELTASQTALTSARTRTP